MRNRRVFFGTVDDGHPRRMTELVIRRGMGMKKSIAGILFIEEERTEMNEVGGKEDEFDINKGVKQEHSEAGQKAWVEKQER